MRSNEKPWEETVRLCDVPYSIGEEYNIPQFKIMPTVIRLGNKYYVLDREWSNNSGEPYYNLVFGYAPDGDPPVTKR